MSGNAKEDFKRTLRSLYAPTANDWQLVEVPARHFLMADGQGDPNESEGYVAAVQALYALSYALKFHSKNVLGRDYVVPPLEGLWWADDMSVFVTREKASWRWTMMIPQPDWLTAADIDEQRRAVQRRKNPPGLGGVRYEQFVEGTCLQRLHIGSYDDEGEVLRKLHDEVLPARGYGFGGKHHEIYLSDPRRVAPDRLKTILRQPVRPL